MVIVAFQPGEKYAVNYTTLDQYDYGQILRIQGLKLPKTVEVHFSTQETGGTSITRVGVTKDGVTDVLIPDSVLENGDATQNYSIFAFVYITDATSGKTEYRARLEVKARPKPEVPGGGNNPDIFHEAVLEVRKSAEKAEEAQKQAEGWAHGREDLPERAEDNAMYYAGKTSENAKKTAQDRAEVERLTESNTQMQGEVAKDLEEVKKLSSQVQTSATNAALSEQKSEEAATRAETAQTGAETAEDNAELAAQKTEKDKTAVEQAKKLIQQMGQEVLDNKNAVDKTAQDFTLKAQQALADVNNAGQTQTERVQTAGATAVENIKIAQNTATQAVETAKAEAIKTVADKGKEVLEAIPNFDVKLDTKLDKNQGAEHAGKALVIGKDGNVVPGKVQTEGVGDAADAIVNTVSGTLLNIKDSAERKNKGFGMTGKTTQDETPTPDAPVEIVNAGRLNEDTGKYEVDVKVNGGNLLDEDHFFDTSNWKANVYRMHLKPDTKYTFSRKDNSGVGSGLFLSVKNTVEGVFTQIVNSNSASSCKQRVTFTTNNSGEIYFELQNNNNKLNLKDFLGFAKLEVGTIATPHEPYKEQTLTLTSDRPITKWDRLVERNGEIGWLYKSEIIDKFDGKSNRISMGAKKGEVQHFLIEFKNTPKGNGNADIYVDKYRAVQTSFAMTEFGVCCNWNDGIKYFSAPNINITNTEEFKAWLSENPLTLEYETETTEFLPLPQQEQDAIRALTTYYPTTVVSNSEDAEMQLTYVADTKNYTDRKIEETVSAQTQNLANLLSLMPLSTQAAMIENDTNNILDNMEVQK